MVWELRPERGKSRQELICSRKKGRRPGERSHPAKLLICWKKKATTNQSSSNSRAGLTGVCGPCSSGLGVMKAQRKCGISLTVEESRRDPVAKDSLYGGPKVIVGSCESEAWNALWNPRCERCQNPGMSTKGSVRWGRASPGSVLWVEKSAGRSHLGLEKVT